MLGGKEMNIEAKLTSFLGKEIKDATKKELYDALRNYVYEQIQDRPLTVGEKKLYYISAEFLTGKQLGKNLINLGIYEEVNTLLKKNEISLSEIETLEPEPSLGKRCGTWQWWFR